MQMTDPVKITYDKMHSDVVLGVDSCGDLSINQSHKLGLDFEAVDTYCPLHCSASSLLRAFQSKSLPPMEEAQANDLNGFLDMLERGSDWLIEPLKILQPRSWTVLAEESTTFCAGVHAYRHAPAYELRGGAQGFFFVRGRAIQVESYGILTNYEKDMSAGRHGTTSCLPDVLSHTWLWRVNGWRISPQLPISLALNRQMIGGPNWKQIDDVLDTYGKGQKKKYLPAFKERFPDLVHHKTKSFLRLRNFLDTRPEGVNGPVGDQFFVFMHRVYDYHWNGQKLEPPAIDASTVLPSNTVYHIHRGDAEKLRTIPDEYVAEAFDRYHEHVLTRTPGEFDFMPYSRPV